MTTDTRPRPHEPRRVSPGFRAVVVPAAVALGAIGAIAAERVNLPWILGALVGALVAGLTVLALPSLPTRRVTVVLLGVGGLGALRHASFAGNDRSWLLVVWAAATMVTLVLVDRADSETLPPLAGGRPYEGRWAETARVSAIVSVLVIVAAVALVPTVTDRLGRHVWPGLDPSFGSKTDAPTSLRESSGLDLTQRPRLSDKVVFTVDAARPDYWRGETFDQYDKASWSRSSQSAGDPFHPYFLDHDGTSVHVVPAENDIGAQVGQEFKQTFHIETGFSDIVFAAPSPRVVQTDKLLFERPDGTLRVGGGDVAGFGKGSVYTVISRSVPATSADLRAADRRAVPEKILSQYARMPDTTARVHDLAQQITAGRTNTFDKVQAIEAWLGANIVYSINAPLSPSGVDVVDDFLFRSHEGWCEQIASSLVVLARSVGIPARLVTGFVPGERDALTGRFVVRERDAHAWAEIYFPGVGWQGFDPTASVPLAGDAGSGGSWLESARQHAIPLGLAALALVLLAAFAPNLWAAARRRRVHRISWSTQTMTRLERIGRRRGRARAPAETPREYADALAAHVGDERIARLGEVVDADAFSAAGVSPEARADADAVLTSL